MTIEIQYVTPRYKNLTDLARKFRCKRFLEIGTWRGSTAQNLILTAKEYCSDEEIYYVGVDLFEQLTPALKKAEYSKEKVVYRDVLAKLWPLGVDVSLNMGFSYEVLPILPDQVFDLIFVDGGHSIKTIMSDWEYVQRFIGPDTIVVFDDYRHGDNVVGCRKLIDRLDTEVWNVEHLDPVEKFKVGKINLVKVCKQSEK